MKLRIGIFCHSGCGGSSRIAVESAKGLAGQGHAVHLFTRTPPFFLKEIPASLTCQTLFLKPPPAEPCGYLHLDWRKAERTAMKERVSAVLSGPGLDVIHIHYALPFVWLLEEIRKQGERLPATMVTLHGTDLQPFMCGNGNAEAFTRVLETMDALTTVSRGHAARLAELSGKTWDIEVIPNFIPFEDHGPPPKKPPLTQPHIIHVSNFRPVKNISGAIEAFEHVRRVKDARLTFVGDGERMAEARTEIKRRNLAGAVRFAGLVDNVLPLLQSAHVMLVSSRYESFGLAILEAMARGVPVVAPDVGGIPEVIRHGETGFVFPPGDFRAAADFVLWILQDPERYERMRSNAVAWARKFDRERTLRMYVTAYHRILKKDMPHG